MVVTRSGESATQRNTSRVWVSSASPRERTPGTSGDLSPLPAGRVIWPASLPGAHPAQAPHDRLWEAASDRAKLGSDNGARGGYGLLLAAIGVCG